MRILSQMSFLVLVGSFTFAHATGVLALHDCNYEEWANSADIYCQGDFSVSEGPYYFDASSDDCDFCQMPTTLSGACSAWCDNHACNEEPWRTTGVNFSECEDKAGRCECYACDWGR